MWESLPSRRALHAPIDQKGRTPETKTPVSNEVVFCLVQRRQRRRVVLCAIPHLGIQAQQRYPFAAMGEDWVGVDIHTKLGGHGDPALAVWSSTIAFDGHFHPGHVTTADHLVLHSPS